MAGVLEQNLFEHRLFFQPFRQEERPGERLGLTAEGKSAVGTKLDPAAPAYKALAGGHSFTGEVTAFGKKYDGSYAPLTGADGKVTGALFVGVAK